MIKNDEPPSGNIWATFAERMPWFFISIQRASKLHKIKTPKKPARNARDLRSGINKTETNAAMAMLHHGKYKPATKERRAVRMIATVSFILFWNFGTGKLGNFARLILFSCFTRSGKNCREFSCFIK